MKPLQYVPNFGEQVIIDAANRLKIPYDVLKGPHTVQEFTLNFLPFTAVRRTSDRITHDFGVSRMLGINDRVVVKLVYDLGIALDIKTVRIIT